MKHRWLVLFVLLALAGLCLLRGTAPLTVPRGPTPARLGRPAARTRAPVPGVPAYTIADLGMLGASFSEAFAINAAGQIAGESNIDPTNPRPIHAFFWAEGEMGDLGTLASGDSWAYALNTAGQVVGAARIRPEGANDAALWQNGTIIDLGDLGGWQSEAHGINAKGQVVGWSKTDRGQLHAFLWEKGRMTDLGTLGGESSTAQAINDAGQVVGESDLAGGKRSHAFLWEKGRMRDLGPPGARDSGAHGINRAGVACGDADGQACVWENGVFKGLGSPGHLWSINAARQAVGQIGGRPRQIGGGRSAAGLWENGQAIHLQDLLPAGSGWTLQAALSINDAGRIVGFGSHNGKSHGFLMSPQ